MMSVAFQLHIRSQQTVIPFSVNAADEEKCSQ